MGFQQKLSSFVDNASTMVGEKISLTKGFDIARGETSYQVEQALVQDKIVTPTQDVKSNEAFSASAKFNSTAAGAKDYEVHAIIMNDAWKKYIAEQMQIGLSSPDGGSTQISQKAHKFRASNNNRGTKDGRKLMDDLLFQQMLNDIRRLQEIDREIAELEQELAGLEPILKEKYGEDWIAGAANKYLDEAAQANIEKLPPEQKRLATIRALLESDAVNDPVLKRALEIELKLAELKAEKEALLEKIAEHKAKIEEHARVLHAHKAALLQNRVGIEKGIDYNQNYLARLDQLQKASETSGSQADLIALLNSAPDFVDIQIPEEASLEEKVAVVKAAVNKQTAELQIEQIEIEEDIAKVEEEENTLNVIRHTDRIAALEDSYGTAEAKDKYQKEGISLSFSLASAGDNSSPSEPAVQQNTDIETPDFKLTGMGQEFS